MIATLARRLLLRTRNLVRFYARECPTFAAAIAYQMMMVFFPGLLLVKSLKEWFGVKPVPRFSPIYAEIDVPNSIETLVNGFLKSAQGLTGLGKPIAGVVLVLLVLNGLSRVFSEYYNASALLFDKNKSFLRNRIVGGIASVFVLVCAIGVFLALNGSIISRQPHLLKNYGTFISVVSTSVSFLVLTASVVILLTFVARKELSKRAIWGGAIMTVTGWMLASLLFLQLDFYFAVQQKFYGVGAAIITLLLWFYVTAFMLLFGLGFAYFVMEGKSERRFETGSVPLVDNDASPSVN